MKIFSIRREQTPVIIILVIVILLGASYLFTYVPNNEKSLQQEHFRWLQRIDDNIQKKIEGGDTLLSHLLDYYSNDASRPGTKKYIDSFPTDNFILFDTIQRLHTSGNSKNDSIDYRGTVYSMSVYEPLQTFIISASKNDNRNNEKYSVSMQYTFKKFIGPLLNKRIFDHYVVFSNGRVVYEDFPSGLSYNNKDSLLLGNKGVSAASIVDQKVGGVEYKMFLQPVSFANSTWIIAGLHSMDKYNSEKRQLPWLFVLFLFVVALGIFLFIPLIKIFNVGNNDRLRILDAVQLVIVIKLLMSLLFFCFFWLYKFPEQTETSSEQILAKKIDSAFTKELKNTYNYIDSFDLLGSKTNILQTDIGGLGKSLMVGNVFDKTPRPLKCKDSLSRRLNSLYYKLSKPEINWIDTKGTAKYNWTFNRYNNPRANYRYRDYFKMVIANKTYKLDDDIFYLDQIISRTDGSFRSAMSKWSKFDSTIILLGFDMKSLDSVIMPAGYVFAIIKNDGNVLYHSFKSRCLNENLKEEFSDSAELNNALQGRYAEDFITTYYEREYKVRVQPLKGFPYFIVVMGDTNYTSSPDIQGSSFASGMLAFFMLFVLGDIVFVILASSRRSHFKNHGIVKTWLWPRSSCHSEYALIALANIIMIILLGCCYSFVSYVDYFFILLVSIPITTLFVNALFAYKYWTSNKICRKYKLRCATGVGIVLIIINILVSKLLDSYLPILIFELLCVIVYGALIYFKDPIKKFIDITLKFRNQSFVYSYSLMVFTRVIITSGIPVIFFYCSSFTFEQNLLARYREYDFATKLMRKFPSIDWTKMSHDSSGMAKYPTNPLENYKNDFRKAVYTDSEWIKDFWVDSSNIIDREKDKFRLSRKDFVAGKLFNLFDVYIEDLPVNNENFYLSQSADSSYYYNNFFKEVLKNNEGSKTYMQLKSGNYLEINSQNFAYPFPKLRTFSEWAFWILLLLALIGFYFIVLFITKRIFSTKVMDISPWNKLDERVLLNVQSHKFIFAVGLPGEEKLNYVSDLLQKNFPEFVLNREQTKTVCIIDFKKIPDEGGRDKNNGEWEELKNEVQKSQYHYVIIDHFEYKMDENDANAAKLNLIESLSLKNNKKIVILSTAHPKSFLDSIHKKPLDKQENYLDGYAGKWNMLLANAPIIFLPVRQSSEISSVEYITNQIRYTNFLQNLHVPIEAAIGEIKDKAQNINENETEKDIFSIKLQTTAYNFYANLWYSLTKEEKLILYDLAEDGLVNTHNKFNLNMLMSKGLIVRNDGLLRIFNKSFQNFILTAIGDTEISEIKKQFKATSSWSKLQTPLVLIIVLILVFIFASQEGAFTKTIGYVTLLTGAIPTLIQLFSFFKKSDSQN